MKITGFILIILFIVTRTVTAQVFDSIPYHKKFNPKQLHQDLDFLLVKFEEIHPDYFAETPKDTVVKRYWELKNQIDRPLTRLDFVNLFSPVVFGVIKDGHNYIFGLESDIELYTNAGGKLFPIPVKIRERKLFVNSSIAEVPLNSEITHINGEEAKDIIEKILSGYNAESDHFEEVVNSDWFSNAYWINYGGFESYTINFIPPDESNVRSRSFTGRSQNEIDSLRRQSSIDSYRFYEIPEIMTGVIEYNACADLKNLRSFCDSVFTIMKDKNYEHLIIDIRNNLGGTSRTNEMLMEYLTDKPVAGMSGFQLIETKISREKKKSFIYWNKYHQGWFKWYHYLYYPVYVRAHPYRRKTMTARNGTFIKHVYEPREMEDNPLRFSGKIYVLTGTKTYSAAASFAATIQCHEIGVTVGQETGQQTDFYADWVGVTLPNTKLEVAISCSRLVLPCSKGDGRGVIPDFIVEQDSTTPGTDSEMNFVKKLISEW